MEIADVAFKYSMALAAETELSSTVSSYADRSQARLDYLLKLLNTDTATAASALGLWNPNGGGPGIRASGFNLGAQTYVSFDPAPNGKILKYALNSNGTIPLDVSSSSTTWDYAAYPGVIIVSPGSSGIFVKAQYFVGSTPVSDQSFAAYRILPELALWTATRDAAAASSSGFAKELAAILSVWLTQRFMGDGSRNSFNGTSPARKRILCISALTRRHQGAVGSLRYLAAQYSYYTNPPPVSTARTKIRELPPAPPVFGGD